jgi:hypothetical protein
LILFEEQFVGEEAFLDHLKKNHPIDFLQYVKEETFPVLDKHLGYYQIEEKEAADGNNTPTINPQNKLFKKYCETMGINITAAERQGIEDFYLKSLRMRENKSSDIDPDIDPDIYQVYVLFREKMSKIIEKCGFMTEEDKKKA